MKQFILILLFVGFFQIQSKAQESIPDTVVVRVKQYWLHGGPINGGGDIWNNDVGSSDPEIVFRYVFFRPNPPSLFPQVFAGNVFERTTQIDGAWNNWLVVTNPSPITFGNPTHKITLGNKSELQVLLEAWEEDDCGSRTTFDDDCANDDDDYRTWPVPNSVFNFSNNPPETNYEVIFGPCTLTEWNCFKIRTDIKYSFPRIDSPVRVGGSGVLCPNQPLKLRTNFAAKKTGVKYQWQYDLKNASDTTLIAWKDVLPLPNNFTTDSTITIANLATAFPELDTASRTKKLFIRVRAFTNLGGRFSKMTVFDVFPKGPTADRPTTQKACPTQSDGKIVLSNIVSAFDTLRYILKRGPNRLNACNVDSIASCFDTLSSNDFFIKSTNFTIENVKKEMYAVWILNGGGFTGSCYTIYDSVIVTEHPQLTFALDSIKNVSCYNGSDGIAYLKRNSTVGPYTLSGLPSGANSLNIDSFIKVQGLQAGTFSFLLQDRCNVPVGPVTGTLSQPPQVIITSSFSNPDCKSPANGSITINGSGGSGLFSYYLSKNSVEIASSLNTTNTSMVVNNLSEGTYLLRVFDAERPFCSPATSIQTLTIAPDLRLSLKSIKNTKCVGSNEGRIEVSPLGGYPSYKYRLTNTGTGVVNPISVDSFFSDLVAGTYKVQVFNNSSSCADFAEVINIQVANPAPISVALSKENVKCSGSDNGKVTVTNVSGGTPGYEYKWYVKIGNSWTIFSSNYNLTQITDLYPSEYQVEIIDNNNCSKFSDSVDVREPNSLEIDSIVGTNPLCRGETGRLMVFARGGTPPYSYLFSPSNANNFNPLINGVTPLLARAYKVRLIDSTGCIITYPINQVISEASVALNFSVKLSDYKGRNIKCAGDTNGTIAVTAAGGNGSSFSGYSYSINGNPYSTINNFAGLSAGVQLVKVKDGRGCEVSKSINLTQADSLKAVIDSQVNIRCGLDSNGIIYTTSRGGISPFTFSLNNASPYVNGAFSNLKAGAYQLSLKDANGCENSVSTLISSLYSPIIENGLTTAVLCKGLSTGSIVSNISGGVQPYTYLWSSNQSTKDLAELKAGDYTLTVTDSINCLFTNKYTVSEPSLALNNILKVIPICEGKTVGGIIPNTSGGTPSYTYSYDGINFGSASSLINIPLGSYTLSIKDTNNCLFTEAFAVGPQILNLKHDFLILTNGYKMDSLTLVDITSPKSDSNKWIFDSRMIVLDSLGSHTNVVCPTVDSNYTVSMKSFFSTCEYSLTKTIRVLPIDTNYYKPNVKSGIDTFFVSPNPTTGIFTYTFKLSKIYQYGGIVINDINGKEVFVRSFRDIKESNDAIDVSSLSDGKYYVRLIVSNDARTITLVIAK
jgi:uncharacterized protein (DUF2141 family)